MTKRKDGRCTRCLGMLPPGRNDPYCPACRAEYNESLRESRYRPPEPVTGTWKVIGPSWAMEGSFFKRTEIRDMQVNGCFEKDDKIINSKGEAFRYDRRAMKLVPVTEFIQEDLFEGR